MIRMRFLIALYLCISSIALIGQSGKNPTTEDVKWAKVLKSQYPESEIAAISVSNEHVFDYDQTSNQVIVFQKYNQHLMALENNVEHQPYTFYDDMSNVISAEATYSNKKRTPIQLQREKYASQDFFHTDTKVAFFNLQFESEGFQYKIHFDKAFKDAKYLTSVYFHESFPVEQKTISFTIPDWMNVELKEMNFEGYEIKKTVEGIDGAKKYMYTIESIAPRIDETNAPGSSHIYPHILVLSKSYTRNGVEHKLFESTQDLYNWYSSLVESMEDDTTPFQGLVQDLIKDKNSDIEKIKAIYYWVQDNIRYIAFEDGIAGFKPDECQNVFQKKYGDCKGMANLCKQMLTLAGFDARLTWIGTKHIAYDYSLPTLSADNHMICTVMLDGKPYFLDPTESYGAFDEYAERIQDRPALIENGDQFLLHKVPKMTPKDNTESQEFHLRLNNETISGKANHAFYGESKSSLLYQLNNTETNDRSNRLKTYLNQGDKDYIVSDLKHSDITNRDDVFQIDYNIHIENKVTQFGDDIYLSLDYYEEWKDALIEDRKLDFLLPNKTYSKTKYILEIPEGYQVTELPQPINLTSSFLNIQATYTIEDNIIVYTKSMELPNAEIKATEFDTYNKIIKELSAFYDEQITLTKK